MAGFCFKIWETILLTYAFFIVGINYSVVGPTLLDLQLLLKQDLSTLSTIPLSSGLGETLGMLATIPLSRLGHKRLQLAISLFLSSMIIAIIPLVPHIVYTDVMFFLLGFLSAVPSCFLVDVCSELWTDKGTAFQFILTGISVAAIATPLIVEPFLCQVGSLEQLQRETEPASDVWGHITDEVTATYHQCRNETLAFSNQTKPNVQPVSVTGSCPEGIFAMCCCEDVTRFSNVCINVSNNISSTELKSWQNVCGNLSTEITVSSSYELDTAIFFNTCCAAVDAVSKCDASQCSENDTRVLLAYIVLGCILLPSSIFFIIFWWKRTYRIGIGPISNLKQELQATNAEKFSKPNLTLFYVLLFLSFLPLTAITLVFANYLTTFGVEGQLKQSKATMVFMTSIFWLANLIGRIISTALNPLLGNTYICILNFGGLLLAAIILAVWSPFSLTMLWIGTVSLGFFSSPYEGAGLAWAADYVGMSSNLVALSWISVSVGNLCFPFLGGIMFETIGPPGFLYLLAGMIAFMNVIFVVMNIQIKNIKRDRRK